MGKKSGSGSGMNNPNHISESLETIFWVKTLKFFYADPGWKNSDPQHSVIMLVQAVKMHVEAVGA
jgi:hypothetical protein